MTWWYKILFYLTFTKDTNDKDNPYNYPNCIILDSAIEGPILKKYYGPNSLVNPITVARIFLPIGEWGLLYSL